MAAYLPVSTNQTAPWIFIVLSRVVTFEPLPDQFGGNGPYEVRGQLIISGWACSCELKLFTAWCGYLVRGTESMGSSV